MGRPSAAVSWLALAAHLCAIAHVVLVRHETCPTHGEVIHTDVLASPSPVSRGETPVVAGAVAEADADEHCLVVAATRADAAGLRPPVTATLPPARQGDARAIRSPEAGASARALLRLAPKTSPPAPV